MDSTRFLRHRMPQWRSWHRLKHMALLAPVIGVSLDSMGWMGDIIAIELDSELPPLSWPLKKCCSRHECDLESVACSTWGWTCRLVLRWKFRAMDGTNVDWWAFFNVFHGRINRWTLKFHIEILFSGVQRRLKSKSHLSFCFYFKWTFSDSIGYLAEVPPCCCLVPILPCLKETWLVTRRAPDDETLNSACDQVMWLPVEQLKLMTFWQDGYKTFDLSLLSKMRRAVAWQKFWGEQIWDDWKLLRQQL